MTLLKLSDIKFSQTHKVYDRGIFCEIIKQKRYIDNILLTTKNSTEIYKGLKDLFTITKDTNLSSFLNYLKESFDKLTSNQKIDILNIIYKEIDPQIIDLFFKEINLHKINNIENIINREKKWDNIFYYTHPEHKKDKIDLENNSNLSKFINKALDFEGNNRPHKNETLLEDLSILIDKKFINDFIYKFNLDSIELNKDDFYNINRLFLELVEKNNYLEYLLNTHYHRLTDFGMKLKILEKMLDNNINIEKYPYIQYTIEKLYNSAEETHFKNELKEKYEKYMLKE